ncbi:MAG TPA: 2-amino-4-hydroxy-6-hydroxymethyldihydropteridine diphosphokinase [Pyrinomonadaceae bacterium]|nr:2-amino-4-hydroxy-6-hydroxymethyldihydropteridine diphosphokinase [Pyrinomonadaceae bacterium]
MDNEITIAYVGLGSNLGDRAGNLLLAVRGLMEASFVVHKLSGIYETEPVGVKGHGSFLNMAAEIHLSNITPSQMMARMLRIEYLLGRKHKSLAKPRTVDLDLLLFGNYQCDTEFLTIPHPKLHLRRFVLTPMSEIAPHVVHPVLQKDMQELLKITDDNSNVHRWNPNTEMESEPHDAKVFLNSLVQETQ